MAGEFHIEGQRYTAPALAGGLYLVATPIGNLGDISLRALRTLAAADVIYCEDTRVSGRLMQHFAIEARLSPYHDHNAAHERPKIIARLREGARIALISDAGTPLVSDPGFKLVEAARAEGLPVQAVPGASAVLTALSVSGLPSDAFFFAGFLPVKAEARRKRLDELKAVPGTLIMFESGPRIGDTLAAAAAMLGDREAAICRELTKLHEEVRRGPLPDLAAHYAGEAETRGEFVVVIAPPVAREASMADLDTLLIEALARLPVKAAADEVAQLLDLPRRQAYQRALALKDET